MGISNPIPSDRQLDGIYFDPVNGFAGTTNRKIGTPEMPSNNVEDSLMLMASRHLRKLYLAGSRAFIGTATEDHATILTDANNTFKPNVLVGFTIYNDTDHSSGAITANGEHTITVVELTGGSLNVWTTGDSYRVADALGIQPYQISFVHNIELELVGNGFYDVIIDNDGGLNLFTNNLVCCSLRINAGLLGIMGDCQVRNRLTNNDELLIFGNCQAVEMDNHGVLYIYGDCQVDSITSGKGIAYVQGVGRFYGIFDESRWTYHGIHQGSLNDVPIGSEEELNLLYLEPISGYYYDVGDFRIGCGDPGDETVTVKLYELIDGELTEVDSFEINHGNYATYHSLMDMFGVDHLSGFTLKITARSSAGSYNGYKGWSYRSS